MDPDDIGRHRQKHQNIVHRGCDAHGWTVENGSGDQEGGTTILDAGFDRHRSCVTAGLP